MRMVRVRSHRIQGAVAEARRQLGQEARVLHTRQIESPVLLGLFKKREFEVLAAVDSPLRRGEYRATGTQASDQSAVAKLIQCGMSTELADVIGAALSDSSMSGLVRSDWTAARLELRLSARLAWARPRPLPSLLRNT